MNRPFDLDIKFVFSGTVRISASTEEEAIEKANTQFGMVGGRVMTTLNDDEIDWHIEMFPERIVTKFAIRAKYVTTAEYTVEAESYEAALEAIRSRCSMLPELKSVVESDKVIHVEYPMDPTRVEVGYESIHMPVISFVHLPWVDWKIVRANRGFVYLGGGTFVPKWAEDVKNWMLKQEFLDLWVRVTEAGEEIPELPKYLETSE